jgi:hypothetical protein
MNEVSAQLTETSRFSVAFRCKNAWIDYSVHKIVEARSKEEAIGKAILEQVNNGSGNRGRCHAFFVQPDVDTVVFPV